MVDVMVLGEIFLLEVVEGVELMVRCVMREGRFYVSIYSECGWVCLWDADLRDCFVLLKSDFLGRMVDMDVVMEVVVEVVVVEAVDFMQAGCFVFFRQDWLRNIIVVRVVIEVVVGVVVLVW